MPEAVARQPSRSPSPPAKRLKLDSIPSKKTIPQNAVAGPSNSARSPMREVLTGSQTASLLQLVEEEMAKDIDVPKTYERELDYEKKLVLAPMVRTGSLPTRLLSLHYGAGLVWGPEIVDKAIIGATRLVDPVTGVITYTKDDGLSKPIFQCHPVEKPFLIYQIGSSDPELAAEAARTVQQDVAGFDLNCGCPKSFSISGGMGAALLSTPDLLINILRSLLRSTSLPVSCKIRLLPEQPSTLHLAARILRTGVRALTVHCRTKEMRSTLPALWDRLSDIVQLGKRRGVPVICNGDGEGWLNWEAIRAKTGVTSVMIARAAETNPSIFRPQGPVSTCEELIPKLFLPIVAYTDNHMSNTKFLLQQFKPSPHPISKMKKADKVKYTNGATQAKTMEDLVAVWGLTMADCRKAGKKVIDDLYAELETRDPTAYPDRPDVHSDAAAEADIWEQRKEAEDKGEVVDEPPSEKVLAQEELDEEEMMNN